MKLQRENGEAAEDYVRRMFRATLVPEEEVDMVTRRLAIEVKSCDAFQKSGKGKRKGMSVGRFAIKKTNHAALKRYADEHYLRAVYVFVVRIGNYRIMKKVDWHRITLPPKTIHAHLSWQKVWEMTA